MSVTVKSIIDAASRKIGILAGGGAQLDLDEYADGIALLRQMLDCWSLEDLLIPFHPTELFALDPGRNFYSMGDGGDWHTVRPEQVLVVRIQEADGRRRPLRLTTIEMLQHQALLTSRRPTAFAVNRDARFLYVEFDAFPEAGTAALVTTLKPFNGVILDDFDEAFDPAAEPASVAPSGFTLTGITSEIDFPSGYLSAIILNLAVHMAAEYGKPVREDVVAMAANAKRLIKRRNWRPIVLRMDPALQPWPRKGSYDVTAGPT